jgi:phosphatidylglycerol lysyltransferase
VAAHGLFIVATTLLDQLGQHRSGHLISSIVIDIPLLIGVSLLYLASLLRRRKQTAWLVTVLAYVFYLGISLYPLLLDVDQRHLSLLHLVGVLVLPATVLSLLGRFRTEFSVRSDQQGFRTAIQFSLAVLVLALVYGTAGFSLLDKSDFHQEIGIATAAHYTVDRFDLTTVRPVHAYTRRAMAFADSLTVISSVSVVYVVIALFQPLRLRLVSQVPERRRLQDLLERYGGLSEDYFKLWPHDKHYYFSDNGEAGLAYHVWRGVALCLGDPIGQRNQYGSLLDSFQVLCHQNDWLPAFVHIQGSHRGLYQRRGFVLQKLGQEAVVDLEHFENSVATNKYFRHIRNKFTKQGFDAELLQPPHHDAVISRLHDISDDWLARGGHVERGFAMGSFNAEYMQACPIMVVRDAAGTIQAFANQLPATFDSSEATYDLLRSTKSSLGNINDYLLMHFITTLRAAGYQQLNLGLCPLTGLDAGADEGAGLIHNLLRFAYANGDRLYSFSGLHRFKSKYEPEWRDRYVAYQGGIRGFTRTTTALMRTMRIKR